MEMFHLDNPEFWVLVGFVLVIALLMWKGVPAMVGKMLDQRAAVISAELDEAKRLRAEAAALLADYKKRAAGAEAEARAIVEAAASDAALNEIRGLAADSAVNAAQKLIAGRLDEKRASDLISDGIKGLGEKLN